MISFFEIVDGLIDVVDWKDVTVEQVMRYGSYEGHETQFVEVDGNTKTLKYYA